MTPDTDAAIAKALGWEIMTYDENIGGYRAIWDASRLAALEEAAKVCDLNATWDEIMEVGSKECAAAIRALKG